MSTSGRSTAASLEASSLSAGEGGGRLAAASPATSSDTVEMEERSGELVQVTLGQASGALYGAAPQHAGPPPPTFSTFVSARSRPTSLERRSQCSRSQSRQSHHSTSSQMYAAGTYPGHYDPAAAAAAAVAAGFDPFDDPAVEVEIGEPAYLSRSESRGSHATCQAESATPLPTAAGDTTARPKPPAAFKDELKRVPVEGASGTDQGYTADDEYEDARCKQLLRRAPSGDICGGLQKQMPATARKLSTKVDGLASDRYMDTNETLLVIRSQLNHLTKSVESCQSEVTEVRKDVHLIHHEMDQLQSAKDEMIDLRDSVARLHQLQRRRKGRSIDQGLTCFLVSAIFSSVLGMFQFGYNTGVINAPQQIIQDFIAEVWLSRYGHEIAITTQDLIWSVAVSIFAIGGMVGGFSGGYIANKFGRKGGLIFNDFVGLVGAALMGLSHMATSFEMLIIGRLVIGYNCGLSTSLVPMYVSEIAPVNLRGGVGIVNQLAVTIGLLLSQVLGLDQLLGTPEGWPLLLGLAVCPSALQLLLLPMCPESPRYLLITKQREQQARKALRQLRNTSHIEDDVEEMRAEERAQQTESRTSMVQMVRTPSLRAPLIISIVMQLSQQLSGINAVFYYSTNIFEDAQLSLQNAKYATMGVGVVMVVMTIVSILLIEREGRRTLHLWGLGGMFFFSVFITISFLVKQMISWIAYMAVISTFGFVIFFAVGPGSIPWMITAELFSQGPRPAAMSIAVLINWSCNFAVGIAFLPLKNILEDYTFLPFSILLATFWIFTFKCVPETKGKTFEEISGIFRPTLLPSSSEPMLEDHNYGSTVNCLNAVGYDEHAMMEPRYRAQSPSEPSESDPEVMSARHHSLERPAHYTPQPETLLERRSLTRHQRRSLDHLERLERLQRGGLQPTASLA